MYQRTEIQFEIVIFIDLEYPLELKEVENTTICDTYPVGKILE